MHGYTHDKDSYLRRLRRIEGQVRGLQRMIDEDKYCIDILTQVAAATKALQSVALGLLEEHLSHCVAQAMAEGGDGAADKVQRGRRRDRPPGPVLRSGSRQMSQHVLEHDVGDQRDRDRRDDLECGRGAQQRLHRLQVRERLGKFGGVFPVRVVVRVASRSASTSGGALSSTMLSKRG